MEEQAPSQPEPTGAMPPPTTGRLAAPPPPARARSGCVGRLFAALLVIVITTFLALAAGAAGLIYFGFTPTTPRQLADAEAQVAMLVAANGALQTQVSAAEQRGSADHEALGEIKAQLDAIAGLREQLAQERDASAAQNATLVADVRAGRDAVALFATAEAGRAALLSELDRRSARVERFLQRLGDIADDTASDITGATTALPVAVPTPSATPLALPTVTPASTATEVPSRTPTPTPK